MPDYKIKKVAVVGSGDMGSQIAAHMTNAGLSVLLLDIVPRNMPDRSVLAKEALAKMQRAEPSPFMHPENAKLITPGNLEDDLDKCSDADWIIEVVLENPRVKSDLYRKIDVVRKEGSIVSSNTSTIPLQILVNGQTEKFARDFLITHFFNPPRTMRLMELVVGKKTSPEAVQTIEDFCDRALGKGVVRCKDVPGFIANRLGLYFLQCGVNAAFDLGLSVEEADAVFSASAGMPKTGIFGQYDLIGLDLMPQIVESFLSTLSSGDPFCTANVRHPLIEKMIAGGYTGRKSKESKGGFYRHVKTETGVVVEAIDLVKGEYRESRKAKLETILAAGDNLRALCDAPDKIGKFAWNVLSRFLAYAAEHAPQIADDIAAVDAAICLGFNWRWGPFELIDKLGAKWLADKLKVEGRAVPELLQKAADCCSFYRVRNGNMEHLVSQDKYKPMVRPEGILLLDDIRYASSPVARNKVANVWDIGDGVLCFEFHTKMNTIDDSTLSLLKDTIAQVEESGGKHKGLIIYNEGHMFSAGADLKKILFQITTSRFSDLSNLLRCGQDVFHALRFARFPTVSAPAGLVLGGACEISLHCSAIQAHAETYMGLVEALIGVIPGWGGCTQMLGRAIVAKRASDDPFATVFRLFETISQARKSKSAFDARDLAFLRETDGITMNRDRLLFDAKQRLLKMAENYTPPEPLKLNLPGLAGCKALHKIIEDKRAEGKILPHDVVVQKSLATVLCGGEGDADAIVTEAQLLELENREFMKLGRLPETIARIEHMLKTGKALRN
ncbi:MAG: 3-hydroxyacyl-CoA dehydrogenase/enoyl-CoA hydratase family protein [Bdellovibrionales bacterium]